MKVVIQRAKNASVTVNEKQIGAIDFGFVVLVGVTEEDSLKDVESIVNKMIHLRIFEDDDGKMNRSLIDVEGSILSISQFTLYADTRKGRRPSFIKAAHPDKAIELYEIFNEKLRENKIDVATGEFGAMMDVKLINVGPVTIILETKDGQIV